VNTVLLRRTWRALSFRTLVIGVALAIWGFLMPVIYSEFGAQFKQFFESGAFPKQFAEFAGGDVFSLPGAIALGFVHPISVALVSVYAVGFASSAVAGERQRGTLEVLLARPLSRRETYATLLLACLSFIAIVVAAQVIGSAVGAAAFGVLDEVSAANLVLLWFNGVLLYVAFAAIGLAASVSFDRLGPALGIALGFTVVSYFLQILGTLWPDAQGLQPYSLFQYLHAKDVLTGAFHPLDLVVLGGVAVLGVAWALLEFPRRDLAAPS
jgi:ABC-type transport system involved in multi-copper enzyme maturation permease subunit